DDDRADDRRDAEDLFAFDAQTHRVARPRSPPSGPCCLLLCYCSCRFWRRRSLFSLLCSVLRLMPRISAARVLLSRVCARVIMIRRRSASATVVPGARATCGWGAFGVSPASGAGRCLGSMSGPG